MDRSTQDSPLTSREHEIATAYAKGETYRSIAAHLFIAPSTVRTHLATIYRKLGVSSKIELHNILSGDAPVHIPQGEEREALISELALSLDEAISRERALGEVLRIISRSRGKTDEVMASALGYALDLCDAEFGILLEYDADCQFRMVYMSGIPPVFAEWLSAQQVVPASPQTGLGRVAATCEIVNIADVRGEAIYKTNDSLRWATTELGGARSFAAIPMMSGERLIGAFTVYRQTLRPFDKKALDIARMFADQSAIAIANARLLERANSFD